MKTWLFIRWCLSCTMNSYKIFQNLDKERETRERGGNEWKQDRPVDLEFSARQSSWLSSESQHLQASAENSHFCRDICSTLETFCATLLYKFTLLTLSRNRKGEIQEWGKGKEEEVVLLEPFDNPRNPPLHMMSWIYDCIISIQILILFITVY